MAKKVSIKKPLDNGLNNYCLHSNDSHSQKAMSALKKDRATNPNFGFIAGLPTEALDPETAARRYLEQTLASDAAPTFTAPVVNKVESEFRSIGTETIPLTGTTTVKFRQMLNKIPVYGTLVTVELDDKNELVGINSSLGTPTGVSPIAKISAAEVVKAVSGDSEYQADVKGCVPRLSYFYDIAKSKWRLVFIIEDVPVKGGSSKQLDPLMVDYVVDAQTGKMVATLNRTPTMAAASSTGVDCLGTARTFQVDKTGAAAVLIDTELNVQTFDFKGKDPVVQSNLLPGSPISNPPTFSPSAISAHFNASEVLRFMRTILMRNNIDGAGGAMISSINCIDVRHSVGGLGKEWINAFWNGRQMVYGLRFNGGAVLSLSADLGVVAHEMTHGVTDKTSRLEYRFQSGALNESYSDIFGVIINNLSLPNQSTWSWDIGAGLVPGGKPFRSLKDPTLFGQPDNMAGFVIRPDTESGDSGGVHTNSGIHNKAAFLVLVSKNAAGGFLFTPKDVAIVYYLALTQQLGRTSQFVDSRRGVIQSAQTFFRALPASQLSERITAIQKAYTAVGIV